VFPVDQSSSSTSVSTVFSCTTTRSDILVSRTAEIKAEELDKNDDITSSTRVHESGGSRVRPNAARGRRQPQCQMAFGYIELDTDIAVLLNDPNSKDLEIKRPKAAKGVKARSSFHDVILPGEVLPGNNCLNAWMVRHQE